MAGFRLVRREKVLIGVLLIAAGLLPRYGNVMMEATFLHWAVREGSPLEVRLALLAGKDPDNSYHEGYSPFELAIRLRRLDVIQIMLDHGADPDPRNADGHTPLAVAAGAGDEALVRVLLAAGADVPMLITPSWNISPSGPQHLAARNGHMHILKLLLQDRWIPHHQEFRLTPYREAIEAGRIDVLEYLLTRRDPADDERRLLEQCFLAAAQYTSPPFLDHLLKKGVTLDARDDGDDLAIHRAVEGNRRANVEYLVQKGQSVDAAGADGETPLFRTLASPGRTVEVASFLVGLGAKLDVESASGTVLHRAIWTDREEMVRFLLEKGADTKVRWNEGATPLHMACWTLRTGMVRALLEAKADPRAVDDQGDSPLHEVGTQDHTPHPRTEDVVVLLRDAGAALDARNLKGETPLHTSNVGRSMAALSLFRSSGVALDLQDLDGNTPLHAACASWDFRVDEIANLLAAGADPTRRNVAGKTPLHVLKDQGQRYGLEPAIALFEKRP